MNSSKENSFPNPSIMLQLLLGTRGISPPKMAYEISGISEIPTIFYQDFRISRKICQGFPDFEGFPRDFLSVSKVFKGVIKDQQIIVNVSKTTLLSVVQWRNGLKLPLVQKLRAPDLPSEKFLFVISQYFSCYFT